MNPALILLQSGRELFALIEQLDYEPAVHIKAAYTVSGTTKIVLKTWPSYTKDEDILLKSEALLTVCEPSDQLLDAYLKKMKLTKEDLKPKPQRVILSEEETLPEFVSEDDYEPEYVEEET